MSQEQNRPKPIKYNSATEMPYCDLSQATMEWNQTGTWRYLRPSYVERTPSCQAACPTSNDIEKWIKLFEKGEIEAAWGAATIENPFPAIMGRVCFHPCMDGCNRGELGGSVNINMLERALGDAVGEKLPVATPFFEKSGKSVAIIGSGPAGLACAYHLTRLGHKVTVFEREKKAGGMLRYGIPAYRLSKDVLDREIERLSRMGVEFKLDSGVRDATKMQELKQDYNAVFVAIGAQKSRPLGIPDEKTTGVMSGLDFLRSFETGRKHNIGNRVLVIGGGNTAVDAARTAKRLGAEVTILYRRSRAEMPASEEEIQAAEDEGVRIEMLIAPKRVIVKSGHAAGLECQRMELGEPDESGRRRPVPVEGSEITFESTTILSAIGEQIETNIIPSSLRFDNGALVTKSCGQTEWNSVFAGGDIIEQPRTVVDALCAGKKSSIAIDCLLHGDNLDKVLDKIQIGDTEYVSMARYLQHRTGNSPILSTNSETELLNEIVRFEDLNAAYFTKSSPNESPTLPVKDRLNGKSFEEVHTSPSEELRNDELSRCFHCGRCTECDNCFIYCPDVAIAKKQSGFDIDLYYCKGCGVCSFECPRAAMKMSEEPTEL
ncbi:MAG: FAD-dependent oxidoreductase [Deltaproteobacteria bacterium]|jgi:NADPH-dependent glutamate synthase beta subunit-like oxidoreductase/Pyruvate/2-oxoacid:ferredoxin oxidoreductase delta subunit|nr:FAD-dependent oxidoreductase [Deltaproteobacteria bacterium]